MVGSRAASDGVRARYGAPARRDPRAPLAGRRDARPPVARPALVRPRRDGGAEVAGGPANDRVRPRTADVLDEQWQASVYRGPESLAFCHPMLGTPLDPSKVSGYMRKAVTAAGIERTIRPWHDLRHTALTHDAAAGNPAVYVRARAGHAQATMTERYVHAAQVAFPGAAERAEDRVFVGVPS